MLLQGNEEGLGVGVTIVVICIIAVFVILILGAVIVILKPDLINKVSKKNNNSNDDSSAKGGNYSSSGDVKIGDTKQFLPYERILNYCIDLGNYNYRAIVEVSSLNYGLMSATEQEMVDASYRAFLDALDFPVEFYIQTREFDTQAVIDDLKERSKGAVKKYPNLKSYAEQYIYEMSEITKRFGNSKTKKKFVIINFDQSDLQDVSELTKEEINTFAQDELMQRASIVVAGLTGVGVTATLLDRVGIAEVLYSYYHRDNFRIAKDIVSGYLNSLVVNGPDHRSDVRHNLDQILSYAQNSIKALVTASTTDEEIVLYKYIFNELEKFKQDDVPLDMAHLFYNTREAAEREGYMDSYFRYIKTHPEADFTTIPDPSSQPNLNLSIPEGVTDTTESTELDNFREEKRAEQKDKEYLGELEKDFGDSVGTFVPDSLENQRNRGRRGK